ncbi:MAG: S41 family peptidase, partial [Porphyromonas sp.]|nr:S41 family peptidase [Porphyromonas sp.]
AQGGEIHNITNSGYFSAEPRWSTDGNALIFSTDRYGMRNHASWGSMQDVMVVFLNRAAYEQYRMTEEEAALYEEAKKAEKKSDATAEAKKDKKAEDKSKADDKSKSKDILIEWDNIEDRIVRLTPNSSDLGAAMLSPDGKKLYYFAAFEGRYDLWSIDLRKGTTKLVNKLNTSYPYFAYNAKRDQYFILGSVSNKFDTKTETLKPLSFSADMRYSPREEREAMYNEVVREQAARFYRKDMHGVNWQRLTEHYRRYLPYISNNYDFAEMLSELLGELNVSHTGSRYRTTATAEEPTAELGLFYDDLTGRDGLLVTEVIAGGPFDRSNIKLRAGAVITAIDGNEIKAGQDYHQFLAGKSGRNTLISYRQDGKEESVVIKPISAGRQESLLEKRWVKSRAALVDSLSGGQLGYVHIASMGDDAFRNVYSEVMGRYYDRKGIVIDIRHNGGGRLHEDIEVFFGGQKYLQQEVRGEDYCEMPSRRWNHPSIMLVCENDYSNAHGTPWVYKTKGMGKVVGMPVPGTMTSVNWVTMQDNTMVFGIPAVGYRTAEGTYLENSELQPDVLVELDPVRALQGEDTQLARAVEELMKDIRKKK